MSEEDFPEYWLNELNILRHDYSDEIPKEIIHSDSRIQSKARKGWFVAIRIDGEEMNRHGFMSDESFSLYESYIAHYSSDWKKRDTLPEDISQGNILLDRMIQDLEACVSGHTYLVNETKE